LTSQVSKGRRPLPSHRKYQERRSYKESRREKGAPPKWKKDSLELKKPKEYQGERFAARHFRNSEKFGEATANVQKGCMWRILLKKEKFWTGDCGQWSVGQNSDQGRRHLVGIEIRPKKRRSPGRAKLRKPSSRERKQQGRKRKYRSRRGSPDGSGGQQKK